MAFTLDPELFNQAFPFHLVLDRALVLQQVGPVIQRVMPEARPGRSLTEIFEIERPLLRQVCFDSICERLHALYVLQACAGALKLRGQIHQQGEHLIYLANPLVRTLEDFEQMQVSIEDLPYNDALADLVVSLQTQRNAIRELRETSQTVKRQRVDLERARDEAHRASEAKSRFLAAMSHEMRTPMHGVISLLDLVSADLMTPTDQEYLKMAGVSARSLMRLLDDLLDFSKAEAGEMRVEQGAVKVCRLVQSATSLFAGKARQKGLTLKRTVSADVPLDVKGDEGRCLQCLSNLVNNALKFTRSGHVLIEVSLREEAGQPRLRFAVQDTGIGISPEALGDIFSAFKQANTSITRLYGGTGLGLALVRQLATAMGGEVGVESVLGEGSTFWFEIPCEPVEEDSLGSEGTPVQTPRIRPLQVLVVDDNLINRLVARRLLEREGHTVTEANDGASALVAMQRPDLDAVLMDVGLPDIDGLEVTRRHRALEQPARSVIILGFSASAFESDRRAGLEAGMDGFLMKPIEPPRLAAELARVFVAREQARPAGAPR